MILVKPIVENWGVKVVNFQLESIKTDKKFALSYEASNLGEIAKFKSEYC